MTRYRWGMLLLLTPAMCGAVCIRAVLDGPILEQHVANPRACSRDSDCRVLECSVALNLAATAYVELNPGPSPGTWFTIDCSLDRRAADGSCILEARCRDSVCVLAWPPDALADEYVTRLKRVMTESATELHVHHLIELYAPEASYEHPRIGIRIDSADRIRTGMIAFLGKTRRPEIRVLSQTQGLDVIVLELELSFEAATEEGWNPILRKQVTTLELTDRLIRRVIDYW